MFKKKFYLIYFFLLSNCSIPNSAFLGPIYTGAKTGSVYQASLSYGSNKLVNQIKVKDQEIFKVKSKKKNPILPDIPFVDEDPIILMAYKVHDIKISDVIEPEPLP